MKKKLLIVDDKPEIAKVISIYMAADCETTHFEDPIQAITWLQMGNLPDLIISDLNMPEMYGGDFLHFLKSSEIFKSIPVIILSSEEDSNERIRLLEEGAEDFILKPFNPMELNVRLKKLLK
ncbi:MAG: response regulator [Bacteroidales bacterium]|nr:response regulator [Bacteroidales bacterium]